MTEDCNNLLNLGSFRSDTNYENAKFNIKKLTEYCLNQTHPGGKNKARVFKLKLGIT